jgi:hypothetical protein
VRKRRPVVRPVVLSLLVLLSASGFCQENLALRQDLLSYLKDNPPTLKSAGPKVVDIPEGTVDFYKYKAKTDPSDIKILVILNKYPVGVLQSVNGKAQLLYDLTGDGVLDTEVAGLEVPYWVVVRNTEDKLKTATNNIKQYLDGYYQLFQQETNPFTSGKLTAYTDAVLKAMSTGNGENRDLLYALYCCYRWGNKYPAGTASSLDYLAKTYSLRFGADHPIFYLQFLEAYIELGNKDAARKVLELLLKVDPNYVPAQVYRWQLELDLDKKAEYYADLKSHHPHHWIVSQLKED